MDCTEQLKHSLSSEGCNGVRVNTTKGVTSFAVREFLMQLVREDVDSSQSSYAGHYNEPLFFHATGASEHKALEDWRWWKREGTSAGTDVGFYVFDGTQWVSMSKLNRRGSVLSQQEIAQQYEFLQHLFVHPKSIDGGSKINAIWQVSASWMNGKMHTIDEIVQIEAKAIPQELFKISFTEAVNSGLLTASNARIGLIETLTAAGLVERVGIIPGEVVRKGETMEPYMMSPKELTLKSIWWDIFTKVPHSVLHVGEF